MSSKCPTAPAGSRTLSLQVTIIKAGTLLARYHRGGWPADSFNPNTGKRIEIPEDGARFNPFSSPAGTNVATLYAANSKIAAALESVFHEVGHFPFPRFARVQLNEWNYSQLEVLRNLSMLELTNPRLRQLPVRGRKASIQENDLIHTPPGQYPATRSWARFLHASVADLDGLAWRPRLGGSGWAYVLFGDRCVSNSVRALGAPVPIDAGTELAEIEQIARSASILLI
jgi:hypothetical protein